MKNFIVFARLRFKTLDFFLAWKHIRKIRMSHKASKLDPVFHAELDFDIIFDGVQIFLWVVQHSKNFFFRMRKNNRNLTSIFGNHYSNIRWPPDSVGDCAFPNSTVF